MVSTIKIITYFVALVLVQTLVLNNLHFLRVVTPFLYIYFIIKMPAGFASMPGTILSFLLGLSVDILSNTPGMHAAACTLTGFARPGIFKFMNSNLPEYIYPSYKNFGYGGFIRYSLILVVLHHVSLFLIESLTLFDPLFFTLRTVASILMTMIFICAVEAFNTESQRNAD
jgi:rod shape-determining protein MreD